MISWLQDAAEIGSSVDALHWKTDMEMSATETSFHVLDPNLEGLSISEEWMSSGTEEHAH